MRAQDAPPRHEMAAEEKSPKICSFADADRHNLLA
ncbi:unnamed protein product, partial [marine sediment metagenome]